MKKALSLLALVAVITMLSSCKTNMRRDAKLLAHKTEQCFSLIDTTDPNPDSESIEKFNECYEDMESMMDKFDKKYKNEKNSAQFSKLFMEEIRKSNLSPDAKQTFEEIYAFASEQE